MENIGFCAICTMNYFAYARTLKDSLVSVGHNEDFYLLIIDFQKKYKESINTEGIKIVTIDDLKIVGINELKKKYSAFELCNALKPYFIEWVLDSNSKLQKLFYFDTDIYVYGKLTESIEFLNRYKDASILLLPNITPKSKNMFVESNYKNELTYFKAGLYCGGFYALVNNSNTRTFLNWHKRILFNNAYNARENYMYADQKILDFAPLLFDFVKIYKNETYNLGHWNYFENELTENNGTYFVNNNALTFMHFSNLYIFEENIKSSILCNISLKDEKVLFKLCLDYWEKLKKANLKTLRKIPYLYKDIYVSAPQTLIDPLAYYKLKYNNQVTKLENEIKTHIESNNVVTSRISNLENEISLIYSSRSWKLVSFIRKIKQNLYRILGITNK